jgi:hypothetical protein
MRDIAAVRRVLRQGADPLARHGAVIAAAAVVTVLTETR